MLLFVRRACRLCVCGRRQRRRRRCYQRDEEAQRCTAHRGRARACGAGEKEQQQHSEVVVVKSTTIWAMRCDAIRCNAVQCDAMQCNAMPRTLRERQAQAAAGATVHVRPSARSLRFASLSSAQLSSPARIGCPGKAAAAIVTLIIIFWLLYTHCYCSSSNRSLSPRFD